MGVRRDNQNAYIPLGARVALVLLDAIGPPSYITAVRLTEEAMAKNFADGKWPKRRSPKAAPSGDEG